LATPAASLFGALLSAALLLEAKLFKVNHLTGLKTSLNTLATTMLGAI
jgi:hypothetical protein